MVILSYIVTPVLGRLEELTNTLRSFQGCEVLPEGQGREVVILIIEAPNSAAHEALMARLQTLPSLQSITLTFASAPSPPLVHPGVDS